MISQSCSGLHYQVKMFEHHITVSRDQESARPVLHAVKSLSMLCNLSGIIISLKHGNFRCISACHDGVATWSTQPGCMCNLNMLHIQHHLLSPKNLYNRPSAGTACDHGLPGLDAAHPGVAKELDQDVEHAHIHTDTKRHSASLVL